MMSRRTGGTVLTCASWKFNFNAGLDSRRGGVFKVTGFRLQHFFDGCTLGNEFDGLVDGYGAFLLKPAFPTGTEEFSRGEVVLELQERIGGMGIVRPRNTFDDRGAVALARAGDRLIGDAIGGYRVGSIHGNDRDSVAYLSRRCPSFENVENGEGLLCGGREGLAHGG